MGQGLGRGGRLESGEPGGRGGVSGRVIECCEIGRRLMDILGNVCWNTN